MAEARGRFEWGRTSAVLCILANIHRDAKRRRQPYQPEEFNPYHQQEKPTVVKVPFSTLKAMLNIPPEKNTDAKPG